MRLPKLIKDTILQSKSKAGNHKAIPHNSYSADTASEARQLAKPKAQIILCVIIEHFGNTARCRAVAAGAVLKPLQARNCAVLP